jgi:putative hydrolase of the HAD superfamily
MLLPYKHIFWDLDHTLWDFETNSVQSLLATWQFFDLQSKGISDFNDFNIVYHEINDKMWDRFRKGFIGRTEMRWKRMYKTLLHYRVLDEPLAKLMGEKYLEYLPEQKALMPAAFDVLQYCASKGYKQHIITNGFETTQWQKMRNSGIDTFFEHVITSEQALALKPKPEIFEYALAKANCKVDEAIMIGDAVDVDVKGAMDFGMHAVWYNPHNLESTQAATKRIVLLEELLHFL